MVDYAQDDIFFITFGFNHGIQFTDMFGELTNELFVQELYNSLLIGKSTDHFLFLYTSGGVGLYCHVNLTSLTNADPFGKKIGIITIRSADVVENAVF
jgi:hypothetical protein